MKDDKTKREIASIFNERILTPVLYMAEYEDVIDLICFLDRGVSEEDIYITEALLCAAAKKPVEIVDIREFDEVDRLEIVRGAELIYSEDGLMEMVFEQSMLEDFEIMMREREAAYIRYEDNSSPYVQ